MLRTKKTRKQKPNRLALLQKGAPAHASGLFCVLALAHAKLVAYAKSAKQPQDLAALIEATDAFVTRATVIATAIKTIRNAKE